VEGDEAIVCEPGKGVRLEHNRIGAWSVATLARGLVATSSHARLGAPGEAVAESAIAATFGLSQVLLTLYLTGLLAMLVV
jgi:hypothetical protein